QTADRAGTKSEHAWLAAQRVLEHCPGERSDRSGKRDRKSTRLNSSHTEIYALSLHDALPIYQTADRAGTKSEHAWLAAQRVLEHCPGERSDRSGKRCCHECVGGNSIGRERAPCVKAVPTDPEQTGPNHAKHHAVRRHHFFFKSNPVSKKDAKNKRWPTGRHVHYRAAGEIDGSDFGSRIPYTIHPAI